MQRTDSFDPADAAANVNTTPPADPKRSGGPRTEAGKRRSSLNACKHHIFSKITVLPAADLAVYNESLKQYLADYLPVGILETDLVHHIADLQFRIRRCRSIEHSLFAVGFEDFVDRIDSGLPEVDAAFTEGPTWRQNKHDLMLLTVYESRLENSLKREIAYLEKLQAERKAAYAQAEAEAIRLKQLAESEGEVYEPANDFIPASAHGKFVFSAEAIDRAIDRQSRLQRAPVSGRIPPQPSKPDTSKARAA